ncbi:cytochrome-c peroxidase [Campylobacter sp. CCUG 57310]|uniref:cytochrome-c peroxidase n=1 Tax=Campylobacter sp. CCUG 57310 TaxID=2517362 RepID=UPI0020B1704E|nr:cytochrome c peroxidase [Campylobacter sp. CCUG 57310]QKF93031.1 cytochrome c peroxidase [Campylobacter sp. CCUG 57310]
MIFLMSMSLFANSRPVAPIEVIKYDEKKAQLGKNLFYDTRLSPSGTVSCERCHNLYWNTSGTIDHNIKVSISGYMNPPTVLNAASNFLFFKNGRVRNMKDQVIESITDLNQLGSTKEFVVKKVSSNAKYRSQFYAVYDDGVTFENIVDAIAEFQKALITPNARFDQFLRGDENALNSDEKRGFELFKKVGCINCHSGRNLGANVYYNVQLDDNSVKAETGYYKVPGLRNIAKTAPYFYNGKQDNLKEAIRHISGLQVSQDITDEEMEFIYKFLLTLSGEKPEILK